jgi:hypothetical protein
MTNEAWDEANQASVIAGKPQKVAKNATFTLPEAGTAQNWTLAGLAMKVTAASAGAARD